jgi:hypothetical protein
MQFRWPLSILLILGCVIFAVLSQSHSQTNAPKNTPTSKSDQTTQPKSKKINVFDASPQIRTKPDQTTQPASKSVNQAEVIVEKMIEATGGREALLQIQKVYATGKTKLVTPLGDREGKFTSYLIKPDYQRADIDIAGQKIVQSFYPGGGWLSQGSVVLPMPQSMLQLAQSESVRSDLELRYRQDNIKLVLKDTKQVRELPCYIIEFIDQQQRSTTYAIHRETMMLIQREYSGPSPLGTGMVTLTYYMSDFRWVELPKSKHKIRLAFQIENYMDNRKIGTIDFDAIHLNHAKVTPSLFQPPNPTD